MSASFSEILDVKNYLKQQFIATSSEWVEACITFLKQEHSGSSLSIPNLKNFVYQQWLSADLEEIGVSSLPVELPTIQATILEGCFALQIEGIRDVSRPAYSQLKELENNEVSNADYSAAPEPNLPHWETKPTRMLMLNLTDGCVSIQGMEYKPLNSISPNSPPGVKVLIRGPISCRLGVLFLTPDNIKVLGGEVDNKLEKFSRKEILKQILQVSDEAATNGIEATTDQAVETPQVPSQNSRLAASSLALVNSLPSNPSQSTRNVRGNSNAPLSNQGHVNTAMRQRRDLVDQFDEFENDDFVDNLDLGVLDEIEKENNLTRSASLDPDDETPDILFENEDEDMLQDNMAFQESNPVFDMPSTSNSNNVAQTTNESKNCSYTSLESIVKNVPNDCTVTIKGFIIKVLSKLECTVENGWNLMVKVNDGTETMDINIHNKVLEEIIGISPSCMMKMQQQAGQNPLIKKQIIEAITKCQKTLKEFCCLMDIEFQRGHKPCIIKIHPISKLQTEQLMSRAHFVKNL